MQQRIFSNSVFGLDSGLNTRLTSLENTYVNFEYWAEISSGTTGTITPPTGASFVLDQWPGDIDAVVSTVDTGNVPDGELAFTAAGAVVTTTLSSGGAYTLSGTPSSYPVAIIYAARVKLSDFDDTKVLGQPELDSGADKIDYAHPIAITGAGTITPKAGQHFTLDFKLATFTGTSSEEFKPSAFTLTSFTIWGRGAGSSVAVSINTSSLAVGEIFCVEMTGGESRIWRLDAAGDLIKVGGTELLATASISDNNTSLLSIPENADTVMPMTTSYNDPTGSMVDTTGNGSIVMFRPALADCYAKIIWSASSTTSNHNTQTRLYVNGAYKDNNTGVMLSGSSNLANTHGRFVTRVPLASGEICTPRLRHSDLVGTANLSVYRAATNDNWMSITEVEVPI